MTKEGRSVAQTRRGVIVHASPFNGVKLELGLILLVLIAATLENSVESAMTQLLILVGLACSGAGWVLLRTRSVLRRSQRDAEDGDGQG